MGYIYIAPHIVGNASNWGYCYDSDRVEKSTPTAALRYGLKQVGSDDFWVAEMKDKKIVALYTASGLTKRDDQEEIDDIHKEWGL